MLVLLLHPRRQDAVREDGLQRFWKHLRIGRRWLLNGWQLFMRNPWLLGGMGFTAAVVLGILELIPLLGGLLIALVAPIMLSSIYLSLETIYRQNMVLPVELRLSALKQSPRQLLAVFRNEKRVLPAATTSVLSVTTVLLIHLLVRLVVGEAWVANWSNLDHFSLFGVLAVALFVFVLYILLAASLIYALPLTFLSDEPLMPSLRQSLKASRHFTVALLVLLGVLLMPLLLGMIAASLSLWAGYLLWLVIGSVTLPLVSASLYCSYRDIFSTHYNWMHADRRRQAGRAGLDEQSLRPL
jgi:hypothetical protein